MSRVITAFEALLAYFGMNDCEQLFLLHFTPELINVTVDYSFLKNWKYFVDFLREKHDILLYEAPHILFRILRQAIMAEKDFNLYGRFDIGNNLFVSFMSDGEQIKILYQSQAMHK